MIYVNSFWLMARILKTTFECDFGVKIYPVIEVFENLVDAYEHLLSQLSTPQPEEQDIFFKKNFRNKDHGLPFFHKIAKKINTPKFKHTLTLRLSSLANDTRRVQELA